MKRLLILLIFAATAWYGYKHYGELTHRPPHHVFHVENQTGHPVDKLRVHVGGQTFVKEDLPKSATADFPVVIEQDAVVSLDWGYADGMQEYHWNGPTVPGGPMVEQHDLLLADGGGVTFQSRPLPPKK